MVVIGLAWIPVIQGARGLYDYLQSVQGYLAPPIFTVFFLGVFWKRLNAKGCLWALAVGFALGVFRLAVDTPVKHFGVVYPEGSFLWIVNNIFFQYYSLGIFLVCVLVVGVAVFVTAAVPPGPSRLALASTNDAGEASALLGVVDTEVAALRDGVSTIRKRVTLTARRADVPLTFVNGTGRPVSVRVELASSKLLFPDGRSRVVTLPPGNHTERFAVEARTSGTFTMTVALVSEDGRLPIGPPTRLTVRSAVFSGAGAALTVGAIVFLLAWWANHVRRTRRARRAAGAP